MNIFIYTLLSICFLLYVLTSVFPHFLMINTCEEEEEDSLALLSDAYSIFFNSLVDDIPGSVIIISLCLIKCNPFT